MPHYLTLHHEPDSPIEVFEDRWVELAREKRSMWVKTWFNRENGQRFCWWDAPDQQTLEQVLRNHGVPWEKIIEVKLTTPAEWRWRED